MSYMSYMSYMTYLTYMTSCIWHAFIFQYGCWNFLCIFYNKSDIQRKHFAEVPRGEPYVFGIRRVRRMGIDRVLIENQT